MKKVIYILIVAMVLSSCQWVQERQRDGVAVELNGQTLTFEQLDEITRVAQNSDDSAAIAEDYIQQWAIGILEYADARDRADNDLERLVEDYRHSLYIHDYEQKLVARRKPKEWPDSLVNRIYDEQKEQLRLKEDIVKGVLLIVPQGTPEIEKSKGWLSNLNEKNVEKIEKYAFHYASGYEYFVDTWCSANQILLWLPVQKDVLSDKLSKQKLIIVEDSVSMYLLQIVDKRLSGDIMPKDYARESIERILLNDWQISYLQDERKKLYDEAVRFNKLKRYEK